MARPDVRLEIAGQLYGGWTSITIHRGLDQVAGSFDLTVTERWPGSDIPKPVKPGQACRVLVDGAPVVTGYVDDVRPSYDDKSHTVSVSGRDKTADLVDCSAPSTQWAGRSLPQIAAELCRPFGISVRTECDCSAPFQRLKNNEGDSVFQTLEAAARVRAVMLVTDGSGALVLTRAGQGGGFAPCWSWAKTCSPEVVSFPCATASRNTRSRARAWARIPGKPRPRLIPWAGLRTPGCPGIAL